jgi:hypothetical protein
MGDEVFFPQSGNAANRLVKPGLIYMDCFSGEKVMRSSLWVVLWKRAASQNRGLLDTRLKPIERTGSLAWTSPRS